MSGVKQFFQLGFTTTAGVMKLSSPYPSSGSSVVGQADRDRPRIYCRICRTGTLARQNWTGRSARPTTLIDWPILGRIAELYNSAILSPILRDGGSHGLVIRFRLVAHGARRPASQKLAQPARRCVPRQGLGAGAALMFKRRPYRASHTRSPTSEVLYPILPAAWLFILLAVTSWMAFRIRRPAAS